MAQRSHTIVLLATAFFGLGLMGFAAFVQTFHAWLTTNGTSPLAALFSFGWSVTFVATAALTWRRSRHAASVFLAAMVFLMFLASYIFPGAKLTLLPLFGVIFLFAFLGYRQIKRASHHTA